MKINLCPIGLDIAGRWLESLHDRTDAFFLFFTEFRYFIDHEDIAELNLFGHEVDNRAFVLCSDFPTAILEIFLTCEVREKIHSIDNRYHGIEFDEVREIDGARIIEIRKSLRNRYRFGNTRRFDDDRIIIS